MDLMVMHSNDRWTAEPDPAKLVRPLGGESAEPRLSFLVQGALKVAFHGELLASGSMAGASVCGSCGGCGSSSEQTSCSPEAAKRVEVSVYHVRDGIVETVLDRVGGHSRELPASFVLIERQVAESAEDSVNLRAYADERGLGSFIARVAEVSEDLGHTLRGQLQAAGLLLD